MLMHCFDGALICWQLMYLWERLLFAVIDRMPDHAENFQVLDCTTAKLSDRFDFIYAVAVLRMLVKDYDRRFFL